MRVRQSVIRCASVMLHIPHGAITNESAPQRRAPDRFAEIQAWPAGVAGDKSHSAPPCSTNRRSADIVTPYPLQLRELFKQVYRRHISEVIKNHQLQIRESRLIVMLITVCSHGQTEGELRPAAQRYARH